MLCRYSRQFLVFVCCISITMTASAYIAQIQNIELVNGRRLVLMSDNYRDFPHEANQANSLMVLWALRNQALFFSDQKIEFSYEDPAVYDAGFGLVSWLHQHVNYFRNDEPNKFIGLVPLEREANIFAVLKFDKPRGLTTLLSGELSRSLSFNAPTDWPSNIKIRSNDPRREHFLELKEWVIAHPDAFLLQDMLYVSPQFTRRMALFFKDSSLPKTVDLVLQDMRKNLENMKRTQHDTFFAGFHPENISEDELLKSTLSRAFAPKQNENINLLYQSLLANKKQTDVYSITPVLDVLYSLLHAHSADIHIVILGTHLAKELCKRLEEMKIIEATENFSDPDDALAKWLNLG
jgi:hypothetical protein